jgi:glycosyltransferase involved in cell wall biosynthesis
MIGVKGITLSKGGGGIENFVQHVGARLVKRGHDVSVYTRRFYEKVNGEYNGIKLIRLPSINTKHLDTITHTFLSSINGLFRLFDIVHFHGVGLSLFSFIPRIACKKSILHIHAPDWMMDKWGRFAKYYLRMSNFPAFHFPHKIAVVSKVLQKYYLDKFGVETYYIPGGINDCIDRPPKKILSYGLKRKNFILFSAGLRQQKGCHYLIQAYNHVKTDLKLVISGGSRHSDSYIEYLLRLAKGNSNIIFSGFVDSETMEELYSNAYLYVHPSEVEGLSQALQQAMGYGNCVVASDIPANVEVVKTHGYFFRNKDVQDLANILHGLLSNPALIEEKKNAAKDYVLATYNWDKIVDSLEILYHGVKYAYSANQ